MRLIDARTSHGRWQRMDRLVWIGGPETGVGEVRRRDDWLTA
jgi:hypothetical protein